jgi:hypothetical protein
VPNAGVHPGRGESWRPLAAALNIGPELQAGRLERSWVVAIVSPGWPGSPVLMSNWRLIGPLTLLRAVEAARQRANHPAR